MQSHDRPSGVLAPESGAGDHALFPMMAARTDLLSQVLGLIRLRGEMILSAEIGAGAGLSVEPGSGWFVAVTEGRIAVRPEGAAAIEAREGDLMVMPQGRGHLLGPPDAAVPLREVVAAQVRDDSLAIRLPGEAPATRMVIGAFRFEGDNLPSMLAVLPPLIRITAAERSDEAGWLEGLAHFLLAEAREPHPGAALMISRLIDVLVIRAMRLWVRTAPPEGRGWLGALSDARISRALKAIHDRPFRRWTVAELAAVAGMSRSNFSERFATLTGAAPLHYQTRWKLLLAQDMLRRTDARVGAVARQVGYDSDAAFSRAYKAQFGISPASSRQAG